VTLWGERTSETGSDAHGASADANGTRAGADAHVTGSDAHVTGSDALGARADAHVTGSDAHETRADARLWSDESRWRLVGPLRDHAARRRRTGETQASRTLRGGREHAPRHGLTDPGHGRTGDLRDRLELHGGRLIVGHRDWVGPDLAVRGDELLAQDLAGLDDLACPLRAAAEATARRQVVQAAAHRTDPPVLPGHRREGNKRATDRLSPAVPARTIA
jgi:hypothetical protein